MGSSWHRRSNGDLPCVTQFDDDGLPVTRLLVERGADLTVRVKLPGDYDRPGEIVECTPLGYALLLAAKVRGGQLRY